MPSKAEATCTGGGCYCAVSATSVNFGIYDSLSQDAVDSTGNVEVSCGSDEIGDAISYTIELSGAGRGTSPRTLVLNSKNELNYNLYTDAGRVSIWGDGSGSTQPVVDSYSFPVLCCVLRNYTAYGRINSGQNVAPGLYSDTIIVTVSW